MLTCFGLSMALLWIGAPPLLQYAEACAVISSRSL